MKIRELVISALVSGILVWLSNILYGFLHSPQIFWLAVASNSTMACLGIFSYFVVLSTWIFIKAVIKYKKIYRN